VWTSRYMLPDLSRLSQKPRSSLKSGRETSDGVYCLDRNTALVPCDASVVLKRGALPALPGEFDEAAMFMANRVRQDKFMGNLVPRKQCTFGDVQYKAYELWKDKSEWPGLVHRVLYATQAFAAMLGVPHPEEYTGVHANFYPDGDASVQKHSDDEAQLVDGAPIFSFTYLADDSPQLARDFTIWKMTRGADQIEGSGRLANITLFSGDLLVMQGNMQKFFLHSIEKQKGKPLAPRLNFTVRKFVPKESLRGKKRSATYTVPDVHAPPVTHTLRPLVTSYGPPVGRHVWVTTRVSV